MGYRVSLLIVLNLTVFVLQGHSQLTYHPTKPLLLSQREYDNGLLLLENSLEQIKNSKNGIVSVDYWNIAIAYFKMGQPADSINKFLSLSKCMDENAFCAIVNADLGTDNVIEKTSFYKSLGEAYKKLVQSCRDYKFQDSIPDPDRYAKENGYERTLIKDLKRIWLLDQKFRKNVFVPSLQNPLDAQNMVDVELIIERYGYPGKKLVGKAYENVAWLVIQHSELRHQEKYLPIIHQAVINNDLSIAPLQMLIDRIYSKKSGKQIFGSQMGVDFADDETIIKVKSMYSQQ